MEENFRCFIVVAVTLHYLCLALCYDFTEAAKSGDGFRPWATVQCLGWVIGLWFAFFL